MVIVPHRSFRSDLVCSLALALASNVRVTWDADPSVSLASVHELVHWIFVELLGVLTLRHLLLQRLLDVLGVGLGGGSTGEHALRVTDAGVVAFLNALECQGRDQGSSDTRSILSRHDLDRIVALAKRLAVATSLPVKDLFQSLCSTSLSSSCQ